VTGSGLAEDSTWQPRFPGQRAPFRPGNQVGMRHGAFSARITGPRAAEIAADFMASPRCPPRADDDPVLMSALAGWAQAEAECERLRDYRDVLEAQLGDDAVAEMLTEVTESRESEVRPAMGTMNRESLIRQRESMSRALYRAEMKARTMRVDFWKQLDAHSKGPGRFDMALVMAELDDEEQAAQASQWKPS
jgi:hypothetical protein